MYKAEEMYKGFQYPQEYLQILDHKLTDFFSWWIWTPEQSETRLIELSHRFPSGKYIPIGRRNGNDDVACYQPGKGSKIVVIHDFSSRGHEVREEYEDIWAFLHMAIDEMREYI